MRDTAQRNSLLRKVEKIYAEVTRLLLRRDRLAYIEGKDLEDKFLRLLGEPALLVHDLRRDIMKLERRLELLAQGSGGEEIDKAIEEEFMYDDIYFAHRRLMLKKAQQECPAPSHSDDEALDELYGRLTLRLSPDLNPNQTLETAALFIGACASYEKRDMAGLLSVEAEAAHVLAVDPEGMTQEELQDFYGKLKASRAQIRESLEDMLEEFPFDHKDILDDEDEVERCRLELIRSKDELCKVRDELDLCLREGK